MYRELVYRFPSQIHKTNLRSSSTVNCSIPCHGYFPQNRSNIHILDRKECKLLNSKNVNVTFINMSSFYCSHPEPIRSRRMFHSLAVGHVQHDPKNDQTLSTDIETMEQLRRRILSQQNAQNVRKEMQAPDAILGRAYAELEEEKRPIRVALIAWDRTQLLWKKKMGYLTEKEKQAMEEEEQQKRELGLDPNQSIYSSYLKKKKAPRTKGMTEFRSAQHLRSVKSREVTKKQKEAYKNKKKKSGRSTSR